MARTRGEGQEMPKPTVTVGLPDKWLPAGISRWLPTEGVDKDGL